MKKNISLLLVLLCLMIPLNAITVSATPVKATYTLSLQKKKKTKKAIYYVGDTITIKAKNGKKVVKASSLKYKSSKKSVATVSKKGVIKLKKTGNATITVTTKNKKKKAALKITVKKRKVIIQKKPAVETGSEIKDASDNTYTYYQMSSNSVTLKERRSTTISLLKMPGRYKVSGASWSSSDTSIATVSNGRIYAKKEGYTTIYARYNGYTQMCSVRVESAFDPDEALAHLTYNTYDSGKGVGVVAKNNYSYPLSIDAKIVYRNGYGSMIETTSDDAYCVDPGETTALWFHCPHDSNYNDVEYASFDISFNLSQSHRDSIGANNIKITANLGSSGVAAELRNMSNQNASFIPVYCFFFDAYGQLINSEFRYAGCENAGSTDYITFSYPCDENYETIIPATYKIYVNGAYT